jgi:hypothetical protein
VFMFASEVWLLKHLSPPSLCVNLGKSREIYDFRLRLEGSMGQGLIPARDVCDDGVTMASYALLRPNATTDRVPAFRKNSSRD